MIKEKIKYKIKSKYGKYVVKIIKKGLFNSYIVGETLFTGSFDYLSCAFVYKTFDSIEGCEKFMENYKEDSD